MTLPDIASVILVCGMATACVTQLPDALDYEMHKYRQVALADCVGARGMLDQRMPGCAPVIARVRSELKKNEIEIATIERNGK